jgi:hypothetical protein
MVVDIDIDHRNINERNQRLLYCTAIHSQLIIHFIILFALIASHRIHQFHIIIIVCIPFHCIPSHPIIELSPSIISRNESYFM